MRCRCQAPVRSHTGATDKLCFSVLFVWSAVARRAVRSLAKKQVLVRRY
jgi:hypothetical protein